MSVGFIGAMGDMHRAFADYMDKIESEHINRLETNKKLADEMQRIRDGQASGRMTRSESLVEMLKLVPALEEANMERNLIDRLLCLSDNMQADPTPVSSQPDAAVIAAQPVTVVAPGYIYFIAAPEASRIKIGFSANPDKRIASLMTSSAYKLETLAVVEGSREQEQALHTRFAHLRTHREWFDDCAEIRDCIAELK